MVSDPSNELDALRSSVGAREREEALAQLFNGHRERLRRVVCLRVHPRIRRRFDPSDVLQEAYLEAARRLEDYLRDPRVPPFVWLRFLSLQRLQALHRQHLGRKKRDPRREVEPEIPEATSAVLADALVSRAPPPGAALSAEERRQTVEAAVERLEPVDREILALRFFEELTSLEVSCILGMKAPTVRSRYLRALERLRQELGPHVQLWEGGHP